MNTTIDKPIANKNKVDIAAALKMRRMQGMTYEQIAKSLGCTRQAVQQRLATIEKLLGDKEEIKEYQNSKSEILTAVEMQLINKMLDKQTLKNASLNNTAYAFQQVFNANRLENGKSTVNASVHISIQHQEIAQKVIDQIAMSEVSRAKSDFDVISNV